MISSTGILYPSGITQTCKFPRAGMVLAWAGNNPPTGSLWCNGAYVGITVYPILYGVIGDRYNDANTPANHFKLPDFRNKFLFGADSISTAISGTNYGNWQIQDFRHEHIVNLHVLRTYNTDNAKTEPGTKDGIKNYFANPTGPVIEVVANTTDTKQDFIPPYTIVNYIIYHD